MILLWFVIGILLAFGIARYNESNKLFWQLVLAFVLGYATTVMIDRSVNGRERSSVNLVQVCPTQMPNVVSGSSIVYLLADTAVAPTKVTALESVVQESTPDKHENDTIPSMVSERTRDQPIQIIIQPPECLQKDTLIHHDTG